MQEQNNINESVLNTQNNYSSQALADLLYGEWLKSAQDEYSSLISQGSTKEVSFVLAILNSHQNLNNKD